MRIKIELTNKDVKNIIVREIESRIGTINFNPDNVIIKVRSKQNYKDDTWEHGEFLVNYDGDIK